MLEFLTQNLANIVIGLVLLGLLALAVRKLHWDRKQGVCTGCPQAGKCCHGGASQETTAGCSHCK